MDDDSKRRLLRVARQAIEARMRQEPTPPIDGDWPALDHAGTFVTLRAGRHLRGCIGTFSPRGSLPQTIQEMAAEACCDPRFATCPVSWDELSELRIEISVLSPLERTFEPSRLQVGKHGIYIRRGHRVGCFLPQVATEMRWDAETFLSQCCSGKAGLPEYAWQDPDTEVHLFTTESFGESDPPSEPN